MTSTTDVTAIFAESLDYHADHYADSLIPDLPADWRDKVIAWINRYEPIDEAAPYWQCATDKGRQSMADRRVYETMRVLLYFKPRGEIWTGHEGEMKALVALGHEGGTRVRGMGY